MSSANTLTAPSESRKTRERPGDQHSDDAVADDVDAERGRRLRLLADAAQPQSDLHKEQNNANQRG